MSVEINLKYYLDGHKKRDVSVLARLLTLIESNRSNHQKLVSTLLKKFKKKKSYVLGISGTPGAGKSSLINTLGVELIKKDTKYNLAVIAIDPSSEITGGSILGDKTRMGQLSLNSHVFIRPVSSKASLGGITPKLDLMVEALKCWSFDLIIIETVGVGQSESSIWPMVHDLMMVVNPNAGDDLQAMKRGLLELVDVVCINKAEADNKVQAEIAKEHYQSTLSILQHKKIPVYLTSALQGHGIKQLVEWIDGRIKITLAEKANSLKLDKLKFKLISIDILSYFNQWHKNNSKQLKKMSKENILKKFGKFLVNYK